MMAGSILFQELLIPKIYNMANYQMILKDNKLMDQKKIKDITGSKFTITEFNNLKYMDVKNNIAFFVGNSIIYFEKINHFQDTPVPVIIISRMICKNM